MLRITKKPFVMKFWYNLARHSSEQRTGARRITSSFNWLSTRVLNKTFFRRSFKGPPEIFSSVHQRAMMAYVIRRNLVVFRAGTAHEPLFTSSYIEDNSKEVWLVTNPDLYYPLHQREKSKQESEVFLWKADISADSDQLFLEGHPKYRGIYVIKGNSADQLKENFNWNKTKLEKCKGGMSLMDFGTLVTAVLVYMKEHYPNTPDEFNFQAELKAASHWYWHPESEQSPYDKEENFLSETKYPEPVLGPHKDLRVKIAALETCRKWVSDLEEKKKMSPRKKNHRIEEDEEYSSDEDRKNEIDDLEESIFDLKTYFGFTDLELTQTRTQVPEDPLSSKMADRLKPNLMNIIRKVYQ